MKRAVIVTGLLAVVVYGLWPSSSSPPASSDFADELTHRVWIERLPQHPRDKFDVFIMVDEPQAGVFQRSSAYEGDFAVFQWEQARADHYRIHLLQQDTSHTVVAKVTDHGCGGFDLCLTLSGAPRGAQTYGSMLDWVVSDAELEPGKLQQRVRELTQ